MQSRHLLVAIIVMAGAAVVWAQTQSTSTSASKQGSGSASASASASGRSSGSGSQSGGANAFSMSKPTHVILYSGGEKWISGKPAEEQNLRPHADYMAGMMKKGILLLGGPWRDEPGGMAVLRCKNDAEARAVLDNDPAVKMGVMVGELKAWTVYFQGSGIPAGVGPGAEIRPPG